MTRPAAATPSPLTVAEAAERLGVHRTHVYHWIAAGLIATVRYPTRNGDPDGPLRIEEPAVEAFIADHRQPASP